jgi:hypothetical protein
MNQEMAQALYDQTMNLWVHPEIMKRHKAGLTELPVVLRAVQVVLGMDGSYEVRLNDEVKGVIIAKYKRTIKVGEYVTYDDVEDLHLKERDPSDLDFGHITLISQGNDTWSFSFSFEYGVETARSYLNLGKEYLTQAKTALEVSPKTTMALGTTAGENLIKARLSTSPLVGINTKKHAGLINLLGKFTQSPNKKQISSEYNDAIKFFHKHFNGVRYEPNYPKIHKSTIKKYIHILERLSAETETIVAGIDVHSQGQRRIRIKPSP